MVVRALVELGVAFQPRVRSLISVVLFLTLHIGNGLVELPLAYGKRAIAALPGKFEADALLVDVMGAGTFDFLYKFGQGQIRWRRHDHMCVLRISVDRGDEASILVGGNYQSDLADGLGWRLSVTYQPAPLNTMPGALKMR